MNDKNYVDVLIGGKIYTLGGIADDSYLQQVAAYINNKIKVLETQTGYHKQQADMKQMMVMLNLADDYFAMKKEAEEAQSKYDGQETEFYTMKRELVDMRMKVEALEKELAQFRNESKNDKTD